MEFVLPINSVWRKLRRGCSQSAPEDSLSLGKPPIGYKTILTTPKLGPKKTVLVIPFRTALTLDVKIV